MAEGYDRFARGHGKSPEQKWDIFQVVLACVNNGPENALATTSHRTLSRKGVRRIVDYFAGEGGPPGPPAWSE
jgi:hypothetical protein